MKSEPLLLDRTSAGPSSLAIKISNFPIVNVVKLYENLLYWYKRRYMGAPCTC